MSPGRCSMPRPAASWNDWRGSSKRNRLAERDLTACRASLRAPILALLHVWRVAARRLRRTSHSPPPGFPPFMGRSADISPLSVLLSKVDAAADGAPTRDTIASGFASLDKVLGGGFRRGDLIVLGGDVASGKSALALAIAIRAAGHHHTVFVSGEMLPERIHERALAIEGRARVDDLRRGTLSDATRAQVGAAAVRLRDRLPIIERATSGGVSALGTLLDGLPDTELLIVDQIEGLGSTDRRFAEEAAVTIKALKALALERRVAIFATSQLPNLEA